MTSSSPSSSSPVVVCGKECDHGSPCLLRPHSDGKHDTQHGCVFHDAAGLYCCAKCGAFWRKNTDGSWRPWDGAQRPGACCDNAPMNLWPMPPPGGECLICGGEVAPDGVCGFNSAHMPAPPAPATGGRRG